MGLASQANSRAYVHKASEYTVPMTLEVVFAHD
jgi:hypothetical protein